MILKKYFGDRNENKRICEFISKSINAERERKYSWGINELGNNVVEASTMIEIARGANECLC